MAVNTKTAPRRQLKFASLDAAYADAEAIAAGDYESTGNWSLTQIVEHLARSIHGTLDGAEAPAPLPLRIFGRWLRPIIKKQVLTEAKPGFQLPKPFQKQFFPTDDVGLPDALAQYRAAIDRLETATTIPDSPFFGELSADEAKLLHRNHAALHLSFVRPKETA